LNLSKNIKNLQLRNNILIFFSIAVVAIGLRYYVTYLGYTSDTETFFARSLDSVECWSNFLMCPDSRMTKVYVPSAYGILSYYENSLIYILSTNINLAFGVGASLPGGELFSNFHKIYAIYLSLIDTIIAFILYKHFGKVASFLFVISPASFLISGLHTQLDNVALMYAILACAFYMKSYIKTSILLFSISLSFKLNILMFLPILFLYPFLTKNKNIQDHKEAFIFVPIIAFALYLSYILPTLFSASLLDLDTSQGIVGAGSFMTILNLIIEQTFHYSSFNHSVLVLLMAYLDFNQFHIFFMIILTYSFILITYIIKPDLDLLTIFGLYLILVYAFSPRLHEQYVTWIILGCFLLWKYKVFLIPNILSSLVMLNRYSNVSIDQSNEAYNLINFRPMHDFFVSILKIPALLLNTKCDNCGLDEKTILQQLPIEINTMVLVQMVTILSLIVFIIQLLLSKQSKLINQHKTQKT